MCKKHMKQNGRKECGGDILLPNWPMYKFLLTLFLFFILLVYPILISVTPAVNLLNVSTMPALSPMSLTPAVINDSNSRLLTP